MTVDYKQYSDDKKAFFRKHKHDFSTDTSALDKYGRYTKTYCFADGAQWLEVMSPEFETAKAQVMLHGVLVEMTQDVKFMRIEYWSTDNANSNYYYEKW